MTADLLASVGRILLMCSFATAIVLALRKSEPLEPPFERLIVGFIALTFASTAVDLVRHLMTELATTLDRQRFGTKLTDVILGSLAQSATSGTQSVLAQLWRMGVWGVMSSVVEGVFLISSFVLECAQEVIWQVLIVFLPVAAGLYPVFPRIFTQLVGYAIQIQFWIPMLCLVEIATGQVAQSRMQQEGGWGLYIIAVQVLAIWMIVKIPSFTHRVLSGALSGDLNTQSSLIIFARKIITGGL